MGDKLSFDLRVSKDGLVDLYLINGNSEINCSEVVKDYYELQEEEIIEFEMEECQVMNFFHNRKRLVLLFDGSSYTIVDENGSVIFGSIEYIEFSRNERYFIIMDSEFEEYCVYSSDTAEPEIKSASPIEYYSRFDIFIYESDFGIKSSFYAGDLYSIVYIEEDKHGFLSESIDAIILSPIYYDGDSILMFASNTVDPIKHYIDKYSIHKFNRNQWFIINLHEKQYELIFENGNCVYFEKNLVLSAFNFRNDEVIFEINDIENEQKFIILDRFYSFLRQKENVISNIITRVDLIDFEPTSEYHYLENNCIGDFLVVFLERGRPELLSVLIYWGEDEVWKLSVPKGLKKDPLLCLKYALLECSSKKSSMVLT